MKCFICGSEVADEVELISHINEVHQDLLKPSETHPEGMTADELWYHEKNKYKLKNIGKCQFCGRLKPWNQEKKKYEYYCGAQECKDKMRQVYVNNNMEKHGVENTVDLESHQLAMMEGRGKTMYALSSLEYLIVDSSNSDDPKIIHQINTKYKNASKYVYLSKVEEKTILAFLHYSKHQDVIAPMTNANILYEMPHDSKKHRHIPDIFDKSMNLIISCKDSILHPNMHPNLKKDRFKNLYEYQYILNNTNYNYIQIEGEEDVANIPHYIAAIKKTIAGGGRYVSPPKVDIYVLMQEFFADDSQFKLDTFIINGQGFILRNRNSSYGFRLDGDILECVEVEKFDNVVYDTDVISDIVFGESLDIYMNSVEEITTILKEFKYMEFEEMVNVLEDFAVLVTDGDFYEDIV